MFRIEDGRKEFYQWDLDRRVIVSDPTIKEVHFCNKTDDCSLVVEVYEENGVYFANVPNILLQEDWRIHVYAYCGECYTKQEAVFKVIPRSKPADYVYTETEVKRWEEIEQRCNDVLEIAESISQGGILPVVANNYEELVAAFNETPKESYVIGQNIYVVTVNVPDLWVMEITEEAVAYTYTTDEAFVNEIGENGYVQVGYYKLAQLETKGNLQDYAKKTDLDTKVDEWNGVIGGYATLRARIHTSSGEQTASIRVYNKPLNTAIPQYSTTGTLKTNTPTENLDCVNKEYVDDAVSGKLDKPAADPYGRDVIIAMDKNKVQKTIPASGAGAVALTNSYAMLDAPSLENFISNSRDTTYTPKKWVLDQIANVGGGSGTKYYKHAITIDGPGNINYICAITRSDTKFVVDTTNNVILVPPVYAEDADNILKNIVSCYVYNYATMQYTPAAYENVMIGEEIKLKLQLPQPYTEQSYVVSEITL